jgi:hypothetical protein
MSLSVRKPSPFRSIGSAHAIEHLAAVLRQCRERYRQQGYADK